MGVVTITIHRPPQASDEAVRSYHGLKLQTMASLVPGVCVTLKIRWTTSFSKCPIDKIPQVIQQSALCIDPVRVVGHRLAEQCRISQILFRERIHCINHRI